MGPLFLTSDIRLPQLSLLAGMVVAVLSGIDLLWEMEEGASLAHILSEGLLMVLGLLATIIAARRLVKAVQQAEQAEATAQDLAGQLERASADAARWRTEARELMNGLASAIDRQFERWELSPAEKETALLLLKGLSHKQIAEARQVTEATARQQSRAVYRKAGLTGRHDLAAFFLEDLMVPSLPERAGAPEDASSAPGGLEAARAPR